MTPDEAARSMQTARSDVRDVEGKLDEYMRRERDRIMRAEREADQIDESQSAEGS